MKTEKLLTDISIIIEAIQNNDTDDAIQMLEEIQVELKLEDLLNP